MQTPSTLRLSKHGLRYLALSISLLLLSSCASTPTKIDNVCNIFSEKKGWYKAAKTSSERWGGPITIPMAIMYQESKFQSDAKPPMRYFLGFIPYGRSSSAYGYAQVKTGTWGDYQKDIGSSFRDRDDFDDAIDFVFWYMDKSQKRNGVSKWDGYNQYLNYHEGHGGYSRGSYENKAWLKRVAKSVDKRSKTYSAQYRQCKEQLDKGWLRRLLS